MTLKINNLFFSSLSFMGIVLGGSQVFNNFAIDSSLKYLSYFILFLCIIVKLLRNPLTIIFSRLVYFICISFLFIIGIYLQDLPLHRIIYLSFSMIIISGLATLTVSLFDNVKDLRRVSYYIFYGVLLSTILGIFYQVPMFTVAVEGVGATSLGFNGGMLHKNFYAITILTSYILLFISRKYGVRHNIDSYVLWFEFFLILISNSRTVYLILIIFYCINNWKLLLRINKKQRILVFIPAIFISLIIAIIFFEYLTNNSDSYTYRVQGIINFFNYYQSDYFHLLFGDAQLAFGGTTQNYTYNIRSVIGWNGTVEMPLLSIMIKNGFIGLLGYTVVLLSFFKNIKKIKNINIKNCRITSDYPIIDVGNC
ncbi:oligosaccharide repeat unit polymerase Wzy [Streptococcus agalactiae]|uniref:oligosaccharide repeat unit polymerase Wzy n=1 Tax=Streptococcus agalactiae TaxID=1311 RepID=UPI000DFA0C79|nr:oligosaccharide repeat unit polymerase Wzy [Streptococcus agalactiae]SUN18042.1 oligosaccharide repeat unit polymerase [Streptococcus agalactiae]